MTTSPPVHIARLLDRYRLSGPRSLKEAWHIVVDIAGLGVTYRPGDSVGILPKNPIELVQRMLAYAQMSGREELKDPRTSTPYVLLKWLHERVDISVLHEAVFRGALSSAHSPVEAEAVRKVEEEYRASLPEGSNLRECWWGRHMDVPTFLERYLPSGVDFVQLQSAFIPITPRYYSIASSPMLHPDRIDLLVSKVDQISPWGHRVGIGSHYLAYECPLEHHELRFFVQPTQQFTLPEEVLEKKKPLIMVGPGTGVAPFRSFVQHMEAVHAGAVLHDKLWLFFGHRHSDQDFFYKDFWERLLSQELLRFDAAFSRDSSEKEYVQNKMWHHRQDFFRWIDVEGGYLYLCGDAKKMAKDVEETLLKIASSEGAMERREAEKWLQQLRRSGRYRKEVY